MKLLTSAICMSIVMLCVSEAVAGSFTDPRDGKTYKTVEIGNRIWMAENLNYKTQNSKCYGNNASNCKTYGRLYDSEDVKDACPVGWRLPGADDFTDLTAAVDPAGTVLKSFAVLSGDLASASQFQVGNKLKSRDFWKPADAEVCVKYGCSYNYGAQMRECKGEEQCGCGIGESVCIETGMKKVLSPGEDAYEFSARPAGFFTSDGSFNALGSATAFWMRGRRDKRGSLAFALESPHDMFFVMTVNLGAGVSVRCVKNSEELERAEAEREQARIAAEQKRREVVEARKRAALSSMNSISSFTDKRDGQIYKTVKIGMQTWMAENLRFKTSEGFCDEKDGDGDCRKYGRYYYHSDKDDVCPESWHLPSFQEFDSLLAFTGYQRSKEGGLYPDKDITINDYGFSVLTVPASGNIAEFWVSDSSSSEVGSFYLFDGETFKKYNEQIKYNYYKEIRSGYSVRCIKDSEKQAREKKEKKKKIDDEENFLKKNMGQFKDSRDGKIYKTIKIGNQIWMAQNLNYEYKKGFFETGNGKSYTCEETKGKCEKYGRFYNWEAAMKSCPTGWHLPSKKEFKILIENAGGEDELVFKTLASKFEWGKKGGLYENGFAALPAGDLKYDNQWVYYERDNSAAFWTSSKEGSYNAFYAILSPEGFSFNTSCNDCSIGYAFSVRCISDSENQSFVKGKNRK